MLYSVVWHAALHKAYWNMP